jgi:hypothetical protein
MPRTGTVMRVVPGWIAFQSWKLSAVTTRTDRASFGAGVRSATQ